MLNDHVLANITPGMLRYSIGPYFFWYMAIFFVFFVVAYLLFRFSSTVFLPALPRKLQRIRFFSIITLCVFLFLPNGAMPNIIQAARGLNAAYSRTPLDTSLDRLGLPANILAAPEIAVSDKPKNIVILSVESFEKYFLDRKDLTPKLSRLANTFNLVPVRPMTGCESTIKSLYAWNTGIPCLFGTSTASIFSLATQKHAMDNTLPGLLKQAGYALEYIASWPFFESTDTLLLCLGYDRILGYESDMDFPPNSPWGYFDKDILDLAKKEYLDLLNAEKPFLLAVSTIDTHFPSEAMDPALENRREEENDADRLIRWTDEKVFEFINFITEHDPENTIFFVFPDHPSWDLPYEIPKNDPRMLFVLTNATDEVIGYERKESADQYDIAEFVRNASGVRAEKGFLVETLKENWPDAETEALLKKEYNTFIALNSALWKKRIEPPMARLSN